MRKTCGIFVDIEDAAQKSKDQTCIATGTKNNGCFDKCRCIVKKQTDQSTGKKSDYCPSEYQNREKKGYCSMFGYVCAVMKNLCKRIIL